MNSRPDRTSVVFSESVLSFGGAAVLFVRWGPGPTEPTEGLVGAFLGTFEAFGSLFSLPSYDEDDARFAFARATGSRERLLAWLWERGNR
jgi:hypothetical protein